MKPTSRVAQKSRRKVTCWCTKCADQPPPSTTQKDNRTIITMPLSIHDTDPTVHTAHHRRYASCRLFDAIETQQWDLAIDRVQHCPGETSQWGTVVVRNCSVQLLPLHYACTLKPPTRLIRALIEADPDTVMTADDSSRLPIHWAVDAAGSSPGVVNLLLDAYPRGASRKNPSGALLHYISAVIRALVARMMAKKCRPIS